MRLLLALFLFAALVHAEEYFGPDTLEYGAHSENTKLCLLNADSFLVVWGRGSGLDLPGQGQKYRVDGLTDGYHMTFANRFPHLFDRAAKVNVVRTPVGGEVYYIGHDSSAHQEIQFVTPEGRLVWTREYGISYSAFLCGSDPGAFFTYWTPANTNGGGHILFWFDNYGSIILQDTLYGERAVYAATDSDRVSLVNLTDDWIGPQHQQSLIIRHAYNDGRQYPPDTILTDDLAASLSLPPAFTDENGKIVGALFRLHDSDADGNFDIVQSRLIDGRPESPYVSDWQDFLPLQNTVYPSRFQFNILPVGDFLISYFMGLPTNAEIRFVSMGPDGAITPFARRIVLTADQYLSGFNTLVNDETVYYTFSTEHDAPAPDSLFNVLVGAFPVRLLNEADVTSRGLTPSAMDLGIYPNPFNGATRIRFDLPAAGNAAIQVFDVNGRRVMELSKEFYSTGSHELSWSADGLPSGMYWIRLSTHENVLVQKALLIR